MAIRKRPSKRSKNGYTYQVYFDKYGYYKSGFSTKKAAELHEKEKLLELQQYGSILKDCDLTLSGLLDDFMHNCKKYKPNTMMDTRRHIKYLQKAGLGSMKIGHLNRPLLQSFFDGRDQEGLTTNKMIHKSLKRLFNYAIDKDYMRFNPADRLTISGIERHMDHNDTISREDLEKLCDQLDSIGSYLSLCYKTVILTCYYCGLRVSEALGLERSDIDLKARTITVNKTLQYFGLNKDELYVLDSTKNKASEGTVPIAKPLIKPLRLWLSINKNKRVFCNPDGRLIDPDVMNPYIKKYARKIGVDFHMHALRHSLATNLYLNGTDVKTTQQIMRHSTTSVTLDIYTHIQEEQKLKAIDDLFNE